MNDTTKVKVRISKEEYLRTERKLMGVPHFQYPDFIELEGEPVEEKCEHRTKGIEGGIYCCFGCGQPQALPLIEELGYSKIGERETAEGYIIRNLGKIRDKLNEVIKRLNFIR